MKKHNSLQTLLYLPLHTRWRIRSIFCWYDRTVKQHGVKWVKSIAASTKLNSKTENKMLGFIMISQQFVCQILYVYYVLSTMFPHNTTDVHTTYHCIIIWRFFVFKWWFWAWYIKGITEVGNIRPASTSIILTYLGWTFLIKNLKIGTFHYRIRVIVKICRYIMSKPGSFLYVLG